MFTTRTVPQAQIFLNGVNEPFRAKVFLEPDLTDNDPFHHTQVPTNEE
jgi:hypothetical protein